MTPGDPAEELERLEAREWSREPNPTWRPVLRRILTLGVAVTLVLGSLLVLLAIIGGQLETRVAVLAALMALIPLVIIVPTYLWLDRYEAEPVRYLVAAFLWGALIAVVGAFFLNTLGLALLVEAHWVDPFATGAVYLAPVTEETLKGLGIFLIYLLRRHEFDGIIDGIVYAGLIGAGFAFSENILYLGQAYTEMGNEGLTATFIVRGLMGPFGHPLFTSLIGIGIGIAVSTRSSTARTLATLGGWACAVLLHGGWNLSAIAGIEGFLSAYITYQVPLFLGFIGFLVWLRRREGRLIGQYLSAYADAGWLTHSEVGMLSHLGTRRAARAWARRRGGVAAQRSMDAFQDSASDLALLRSRLVHGTAERDAAQRETVLLQAITAHRKDFIGTPVM
ncbi:PrsW family intramembrane metalloprotease [Intrasporangium calvum]|uniref:PrsW family intramembrane metalloprotease n=1 Tax=Intrasporangium calvum TaxID=53358 RepID=A0ABT5GEC9_9MICO|nr:PrsW family intramembrane metalloprotease [Intrasporangium calvum]MDC5696606.1 PrsW family intramembrane metalloprotease [Intrasporangium calvum]